MFQFPLEVNEKQEVFSCQSIKMDDAVLYTNLFLQNILDFFHFHCLATSHS